MERDVRIQEPFEFNFVGLKMFPKALPATPHSLETTCTKLKLCIYTYRAYAGIYVP